MNQLSPIQAIDTIDIVGKLRGGGLDLVIVAERYLDSSQQSLTRLESKLRNYLAEALSPDLRARYGCASTAPVSIVVRCTAGISEEAMDLIARVSSQAAPHVPISVEETPV